MVDFLELPKEVRDLVRVQLLASCRSCEVKRSTSYHFPYKTGKKKHQQEVKITYTATAPWLNAMLACRQSYAEVKEAFKTVSVGVVGIRTIGISLGPKLSTRSTDELWKKWPIVLDVRHQWSRVSGRLSAEQRRMGSIQFEVSEVVNGIFTHTQACSWQCAADLPKGALMTDRRLWMENIVPGSSESHCIDVYTDDHGYILRGLNAKVKYWKTKDKMPV